MTLFHFGILFSNEEDIIVKQGKFCNMVKTDSGHLASGKKDTYILVAAVQLLKKRF